jgi:hypothetical protein
MSTDNDVEFFNQEDDFLFEQPKNVKKAPLYFSANRKLVDKVTPFMTWPDPKQQRFFCEKIKEGKQFDELKTIDGFKTVVFNCLCGNPYKIEHLGKTDEPTYRCSNCKTGLTVKAISTLAARNYLNLKTAIAEPFAFPYCPKFKDEKHYCTLMYSTTSYGKPVPGFLQFYCGCLKYSPLVIDKNKKMDIGMNAYLKDTFPGKSKIYNYAQLPVIEKNATKVGTCFVSAEGGI